MSSFICTRCRSSLQKAACLQKRIPSTTVRKYSSDVTPAADLSSRHRAEYSTPIRKVASSTPPGLKHSAATPIRRVASTIPPDLEQFVASVKRKAHHNENPQRETVDIDALLSTPSWSVRSLLPDENTTSTEENEITPQKLHHLLRLSALPLPETAEEEANMLKTLHSQLHFVRDIQKVDTEGVEPMYSVRDESEGGIAKGTIGLEDLKEAFAKEEIKGRNRRPRRKRDVDGAERVEEEDWDVLGTAGRTVELAGGRYFVVRSGKD